MEEKIRCQSCGMPIMDGYYGHFKDGTLNPDFCRFCFVDGEFSKPDITCDEMCQLSIEHMTKEMKIPREEAEAMALRVIPKLKRWQAK